jgi:hypothetical protein
MKVNKKQRLTKINCQPQSTLENSFPIVLEPKGKYFLESYSSLLRLMAINELYIEQIEALESNKAVFKFEFKKQANLMKQQAELLTKKVYVSPGLMDEFDLLYTEAIVKCKEILNTIIAVE